MRMETIDDTDEFALDFDALPVAEWNIDDDGLLVIAPPAGYEQAVLATTRCGDEPEGSRAPWRRMAGKVKSVLVRPGVTAGEGAADLFAGCKKLTCANLAELDVSHVEGMGRMFSGCSSLDSLDLAGWDVSHVKDIGGMFLGCSSLHSLDLRGWDVSGVRDMRYLFHGCSSLRSLDLSGWDVSNVERMDGMFKGCGGVELALAGCNEWSAARLRALLP